MAFDEGRYLPTADRHTLQQRALVIHKIREFFLRAGILEVDVPLLSPYTVTDVQLTPLQVFDGDVASYLQTSPEFFLKRLLARDQLSTYYLGKAFRAEELGRRHRSEFTMLEWYLVGADDRELMQQTLSLCQRLAPDLSSHHFSYRELFESCLGLNPHCASVYQLKEVAEKCTSFTGQLSSKSEWLDLLFSFCIEPELPPGLVFVADYPACQAALARVETGPDGDEIARRFEVFWNGLEVGNGYWELLDADEQEQRFAADNRARKERGLPERMPDPRFLAALKAGLPSCSGIAMGVDRMLMCLLDIDDIAGVMAFADQ